MQYFGYLRRDPDPEGLRFRLSKLDQFGGNYVNDEMVKAFISSDEYARRFGGRAAVKAESRRASTRRVARGGSEF